MALIGSAAGDNLADAFSMRMTYQTADYTETPQYNGNIASLSWRAPLGTCRDIQGYHFSYDAANRLKSATSWERTSGSPTINNKYSEPLISYDLNGNITQYQRRGLTTGSTYDLIDNLAYTYGASNIDRLSTVSDAAVAAAKPYGFKPNATAGTYYYGYDSAGNLLTDGHKDLIVAYNVLNLPDVFTFTLPNPDNSIEIVYNAAGEKLEKKVYTGATLSLHKRYVMGIEYTGANLEAIYHGEGRIVPIGGGVFQYEYTLKDHLGNSRVMFAANGTAINLLQENHYYPFGMEMKGAWITQAGTENGYQYNGKELNEDWGLNWSDYGARWYDASIGRWNAVDPLADKYTYSSSFSFTANNPMRFLDPNGMAIISINGGTKFTGQDAINAFISIKLQYSNDAFYFRFTFQHVVQKGETRSSIAEKYNVDKKYVYDFKGHGMHIPVINEQELKRLKAFIDNDIWGEAYSPNLTNMRKGKLNKTPLQYTTFGAWVKVIINGVLEKGFGGPELSIAEYGFVPTGIPNKWFEEWGGADNWAHANLYTKVTTFDKYIERLVQHPPSQGYVESSYLAHEFAVQYPPFRKILHSIEAFFLEHIKR